MVILFLALASIIGYSGATVHGLRPYFITAETNLMEVGPADRSSSYSTSLDVRYELSSTTIIGYGRLLRAEVDGEDNSRNWLGKFRLEQNITDRTMRVYYFHQMESDPFSGIVQRDSDEVGFYHVNFQDAENLWTAEAGLRYMMTIPHLSDDRYQMATRIQTYYQRRLNPRIFADIEAEYVLNLSEANMDLINGQIGLGSSVTPLLFIKLNYLLQYQREPFANTKDTSTFTTLNLIAKF